MSDLLEFKIATEPSEFEQICRLNYETFVDEIPQHQPNPDKRLMDKFNEENTYIICSCKDNLLGMLAVRDKRPFSLDRKLSNLDSYLPGTDSMCEIRLLSVKGKYRHTRVFPGLILTAACYCESKGYDLAVISGTLREEKLYKHLGFVPFGPVVGTPEASFQPMFLTAESYRRLVKPVVESKPVLSIARGVSLLPGPVDIAANVRKAFNKLTISHRSEEFLKIHKDTRKLLCQLVNSKSAEILMGSGTLANDVIAGQLTLSSARGLVLSNGEFGERLISQAKRFDLSFETLSLDWGKAFNCDDIRKILQRNHDIGWLWAVHCETSTGMLNDAAALKEVCKKNGTLLCLDCVSSIGTARIDLQDVHLASGVSGKGLAAFSGLCMVFYNHSPLLSVGSLPAYLDLAFYRARNGVPFTLSSNLVYALYTALKNFNLEDRLKQISGFSRRLRSGLRRIGLNLIGSEQCANPFIITISVPEGLHSKEIGAQLKNEGFFISYESSYLLRKNWIQICLMGEFSEEILEPLLKSFQRIFRS